MNCPECGSELKEGAKFCVECGAPVTEAASDIPQITEESKPEAEPSVTEAVEPEASTSAEDMPEAEPESVVENPEEPVNPAPAEPANMEPAEPAVVAEPVKEQAKPAPVVSFVTDPRMLLTTAQYFFLTILFHIPVIGLIFMFVWGLGRPKNLSLKRYSLAMLLLRLIGWLLVLASTVFLLLGLNGLIPGIALPNGILPFAG